MIHKAFCTTVCILLTTPFLFSQPQIIAHRGYWNTEGSAQNSRSSVQNAIRLGCYGAEVDIYLTTDNQLVLFHDTAIQGVRLDESTYKELLKHSLPNGETLPLLDEILPLIVASESTKLIIEIKPHNRPDKEKSAVEKTLELVDKAGRATLWRHQLFNLYMREPDPIQPEGQSGLFGRFTFSGSTERERICRLGLQHERFKKKPGMDSPCQRIGINYKCLDRQ